MELLACFILAAIFTGGRSASDIIHAMRGTEPPHLQKAKLRAQTRPANRSGRSPYAQGKPSLRDVAAVYWGDALEDVMARHNRVRASKTTTTHEPGAGSAGAAGAGSFKDRARRFGKYLLNGSEKYWVKTEPVTAPLATAGVPGDVPEPAGGSYTTYDWRCDKCGEARGGYRSRQDVEADSQAHVDAKHGGNGKVFDASPEFGLIPDHADENLTTPSTPNPPEPRPFARPVNVPPELWAHAAKTTVPCPRCGAAATLDQLSNPNYACFRCPACAKVTESWGWEGIANNANLCVACGAKRFAGQSCPCAPREAPGPYTSGADLSNDRPDEGATTVTAPTGEAVNYETTINELEGIAKVQREHIDYAAAAVKAVQDAKSAINASQQSYGPAARAAGSVNEHLGALNLDAETQGHTGTIADAMPPNAVDQMFDQLEQMEASAQEQLSNAETALASTEAALQTVIGKYGDAHATVAGELGGDSRFLDSGAGHSSGATTTTGGAAGGGSARPTGEPTPATTGGAGGGGGAAPSDNGQRANGGGKPKGDKPTGDSGRTKVYQGPVDARGASFGFGGQGGGSAPAGGGAAKTTINQTFNGPVWRD